MPRPQSSPASTVISADKVPKDAPKGSGNDLLGLSFGNSGSSSPTSAVTSPATNNSNDDDFFDAFVSAAPTETTAVSSSLGNNNNLQASDVKQNGENKAWVDEEADFFNQKAGDDKKLDMASILKLYDSAPAPVSNPLFAPQPSANATGQYNANPLVPSSNVFGAPVSAANAFQSNTAANLFATQNNGGIGGLHSTELFNQVCIKTFKVFA